MVKQKRALAVHDISCVGRCSLTVALPILCAAGVDTSVLPTAVLSTHTGGFSGYTFRDLTADIAPIAAHWQSLGLHFDTLYTGYLGSSEQVALVEKLFADFGGGDTLIMVDPVMADDGVLYKGFDAGFPALMRGLCARADVIVPNITEAALMLGEPYQKPPYTREYIEGLLSRLAALGARTVVLTGVSYEEGMLGAAAFDAAANHIDYSFAEKVPGQYHGSGDVFASFLLGALLAGRPLSAALATAVDLTQKCIAETRALGQEARYGVCFERLLGEFAAQCK